MAHPWDVRLARGLAHVLDDCYLDPALGLLLPGAGDALGSVLGLGIVAVACRRRLPLPIISRMLLNLAIDGAVGAVPVVGDVADVYLRVHTRNVRLLEARHATRAARASDYLVVVAAVLAFVGAVAATVTLAVLGVRWCLAHLH